MLWFNVILSMGYTQNYLSILIHVIVIMETMIFNEEGNVTIDY